MTEFNKEDIETLNFIVEQVLNTGSSMSAKDLVESRKIKMVDKAGYGSLTPDFDAEKEFTRYVHILESFNVCKSNATKEGKYVISNSYTLQFQKQGGFKKAYADQKDKKKKENLEIRKTKIDLELSEKMLKEYPKTKWFARIGFILAVALAVFEIIKFIKQLK